MQKSQITKENLNVVQVWDCYNDCPSGQFSLQLEGIRNEEEFEELKTIILQSLKINPKKLLKFLDDSQKSIAYDGLSSPKLENAIEMLKKVDVS